MKRFLWLGATGMMVVMCGQPLLSQVARPQRTMREELQTIKEANQKLLEQQKAALEKLDVTEKEAAQLRILARRT